MSPKSLSAMDEELPGERLMEVRVDDVVAEPTYVAATLPGQGALLPPDALAAQGQAASPTIFQVPDNHLDPAARISGESSLGVGSRNEADTISLSGPSVRGPGSGRVQNEFVLEQEVEAPRTPRTRHSRPSPSLSSMERGRPSIRGRAAATRESSGMDPRMDQLAYLMESMMNRMDRLEGSERSSRHSGTTNSRSYHGPRGTDDSWNGRLRDRHREVGVDRDPRAYNPGLPVFPQGPCMPQVQPGFQVPSLGHYLVPHASQLFQGSQEIALSGFANVQAPQALPVVGSQAGQTHHLFASALTAETPTFIGAPMPGFQTAYGRHSSDLNAQVRQDQALQIAHTSAVQEGIGRLSLEPPPGISISAATTSMTPCVAGTEELRNRSEIRGCSPSRVMPMPQTGPTGRCQRSKDGSSLGSFHSVAGSEVDMGPPPKTGPQHFYIGDAPSALVQEAPTVTVPKTFGGAVEGSAQRAPAKARGMMLAEQEFLSPIRPTIVRYPLTPGGTEIRPPATTPPATPVTTGKATPPTFGSGEGVRSDMDSVWMIGVPPPPPLPDFASASAQASGTHVRPQTGLSVGEVSVTVPAPPLSAFTSTTSGDDPGAPASGSFAWSSGMLVPPPPPIPSCPTTGTPMPFSTGLGATYASTPPGAPTPFYQGFSAPGVAASGMATASKVEEPSRYIQSLPKLEEYTPDQGAVTLGDWLVTISPVVGSLSSGSAAWFTNVQARVTEHYAKWLASDPVSRLTVRQAAIEDGATWANGPQYAMLEQRMTTLLLEAIPATVKTEVVTVRALTTVGISQPVRQKRQPSCSTWSTLRPLRT